MSSFSFDPSSTFQPTLTEQSLLTVMARQGGMSMITIDRESRITLLVGELAWHVGFSGEDALGRSIDVFFEAAPEFAALLHAALEGQSSKTVLATPRDGFFEFQTVPLSDGEGKTVGAFGYGSDVTERHRAALAWKDRDHSVVDESQMHVMVKELDEARIAAEAANERTQAMLEAMPIGCNVWDEQFNNIDCNREAVNLFGLRDKREFVDRFFDFSPEFQPDGRRSAETIREYVMSAFETGYRRFEWMHQTSGKEPVPAEITLVRVDRTRDRVVVGCIRDLRELKMMLAEIEQVNERTRIMLDATPLCCNFWDKDLKNVDCNAEAPKLFGLKDKQEYLDRFMELSPECQPDGRLTSETAIEKVKAAFETGYQRFEWMHQKLDGTPIPSEITLVRVEYDDGYIVVGYTRDLREFKKMLAEMREADERTQIMLDATPLCCNLWDEQFNNIDCNLEAVKLFNLKSKQEYLDRFFELSPPLQPCGRPTPELAAENIIKAFRDGYCRFEWMHQQLDGTPIPSEITLVRVKRGDRHIVAGYTRDMRELKKNEAALELDRQRMNALLELAQMTNSREEEIVDFTIKSAASLTRSTMGYVVLLEHAENTLPFRSLILDRSIACALPTKTSEGTPHTLSPALTECLETQRAVIHDDFVALPGPRTFPDGHFPVRSHMNLPIMDGRRPIGIIGVGNKETPYSDTDIKQLTLVSQALASQLSRKHYAENLEKAKNEAENANKAKSEFLAHMSHEIRTPLNGVIGLSDLLMGTKLSEKQHEYAELINASGKSLLFLINDILDFSKIEAGKLEVDSEPFDLVAMVESVLGILVSRTSGRDMELAVSFCRNLPRIVRGDVGRIRQVLLNLVGNAIKFTEKGGIRIDVGIEFVHEETLAVRFNVTDTGIGIPKDRIDRLFKAFSQADASSARVYGGTGLGLAISMKLVHLMQGEIGVRSEEGKGSTFWFTIPFTCDPKVVKCLQEKQAVCLKNPDETCENLSGVHCMALINRIVGDEYRIKGRTALIVDDNEVQRETLRTQLKNWEMSCIACGSGEEAIRLAEEAVASDKPFDLAIVDSTLRDGAGMEWARQLDDWKAGKGTETPRMILLRPLAEEIDRGLLEKMNAESIAKPVFNSALFDAVMNQLFFNRERKLTKWNIRAVNPAAMDKPEFSLSGRIHLLVVEDNRINQIVAKNLLEGAGLTCDIAHDGHEACVAVRKKHYDIILMDCQMPEMDGYEATDLIRKWELELGKKRTPIIALTANATKEDVQKCFDSGMDAYCSKPINPQTVFRLIEEWYGKYEDV